MEFETKLLQIHLNIKRYEHLKSKHLDYLL